MSANGDRATPTTPLVDIRRTDLREVPVPIALHELQSAVLKLDASIQKLSARIVSWNSTLDSRVQIIVDKASEETANRLAEKVLRDVTYARSKAEEADARASQAEIKAQTAIETGKHVTIVNDYPTPPPPKMSEAPMSLPVPIKLALKRHTKIAAVIMGIVTTIWAAAQAWYAIRGAR